MWRPTVTRPVEDIELCHGDLERCRSARADHFAGNGAHASESVGPPALEIVCVSWSENSSLIVDSHLESTRQHDPSFFSVVRKRDLAGIRARRVALLQYLETSPKQVVTDLSEILPFPISMRSSD